MTPERIRELIDTYRDGLLGDTLPFWLDHCLDHEHGGYMTALDRDGSILDTDKSIWMQGRFAWLLSTLYHRVEQRPEWLDAAKLGIDFLRNHGFDDDGRMFFTVTRDGRPLRKRRYVFSEMFTVMAYAAYAKAGGDERAAKEAAELFRSTTERLTTPGRLEPKVDPKTRPVRSFGTPMILINTAQVLRAALGESCCNEWIDRSIDEIRRYFLKPELEAVMEQVGPEGEVLDHFDGRLLNPGHAIEGAWFVLQEAEHRGNDPELTRMGTTMLDWMWRRGWDRRHGGIFYFRDVKNLPVQEYWHDMKFWWPQNEAVIATLSAYRMTGDPKYSRRYAMIHQWAHRHFPDPAYGEWYGYLHRDGQVSHHAKGTMWKGPFHLPRMQLVCWQLLEQMQAGGGANRQ